MFSIYPCFARLSDVNDALEDELLALLDTVRLGSLASRMGSGDAKSGLYVTKDWSKVLSLGEQQRLAFARVLYNRPRVVFLDGKDNILNCIHRYRSAPNSANNTVI
jgi:vitamin B12/bleomycin/antimicrobial peptide transport system ATP-binding/permease protein